MINNLILHITIKPISYLYVKISFIFNINYFLLLTYHFICTKINYVLIIKYIPRKKFLTGDVLWQILITQPFPQTKAQS